MLRKSLEKYQDYKVAVRDLYLSAVGCVHYSGEKIADHMEYPKGAMGVHFVNPTVRGVPDPMKPNVLIYEPVGKTMKLVAVEWLVPLTHYQEPYASLNPNRLVPMLEDGDIRLTESSAILKYLADKYDLPSYPKDLKKRAKVNEVMDWLNTQFYRDFGYGLIYPQLFPHHKRRSDEAQAGAIAWGEQGAKNWLQILNDHWIGPKNQFLCGNELSIADYFGAAVVSIGDLIGCDLSVYPNIKRWLDNKKKLKSWDQVNEMLNGFVAANRGKEFVRV